MIITSPAFHHEHTIPAKYTCEGENVSPALNWTDIPAKAKSLVLIVDDPDAPDPKNPQQTWVHWVLYNIPPSTTGLHESITTLPSQTLEGINDWNKTGYGGPCPPIGSHRYYFKLYALNNKLEDLKGPNKKTLLQKIEEYVIDSATLMGTYKKENKD